MSNFYISEWQHAGPLDDGNNRQPVVSFDSFIVAQTPIAIGVTTQSAAFNAKTQYIRVKAYADCCITYGANPTATASTGIPLGTGDVEYFSVSGGNKIAVVTNAAP